MKSFLLAVFLIPVGTAVSIQPPEKSSQAKQPKLSYGIEYVEPSWRISLAATGLDPSRGGVALELPDFGSWTALADYYVTKMDCVPPVTPDPKNPSRWIVSVPKDWDGSLQVSYSLHAALEGSAAQRAHALLPVRSRTYIYGCLRNTLVQVLTSPQDAPTQWSEMSVPRHATVVPPSGWAVFSGWKGESLGPQEFEISPRDYNGLLVMGLFTSKADLHAGRVPIEVRQFGGGPPCAPKVADWLRRILPLMNHTMGVEPGSVRVFLTDSAGGGMMTEQGLMLGIRKTWTDKEVDLFSTRHTAAHELFHAWLGVMLRPADDMIWFQEGFTDYLSLWYATATGVVPRDWFVRRLIEKAASAKQSSLGQVSFLDPAVKWRDDNGPHERMAYSGGHLVAFALDVELRQRGKAAGIQQLLKDLLREKKPRCRRVELQEWFAQQGVADLWEKYIAGRLVPEVETLLKKAGCKVGFVEEELTYLGVQAKPSDPAKPNQNLRIEELDPKGPAARAGARVGDVITGWFPFRSTGVSVGPEVKTSLTFGLTTFVPREPGAYMGVVRDGVEHKLNLEPEAIKGGRRATVVPGPDFESFFKRDTR